MEITDCGIPEVNEYCRDVLEENVPTCKWTKLAVERFQDDLTRQRTEDFPYYFEPKAAQHFFDFCEQYLTHFQGHFASDPIIWEPHQKWFLGQLFGWLKTERYQDEPVRRFREFSYFVAKKNGKSLISACIALYWLIYESPGTQVLGMATSMQHAKRLSYSVATKMIKHNDDLGELFKVNKSIATMAIECPATDSTFRPVPTDENKLDGTLNSLILADETKDITNFAALDTLLSGQTTVISPLFINISTAGYNTSSIGNHYYERDKKILTGELEDESVLPIIYTIDSGDEENWDDPEVWKKANPLYGTTVLESYVESRVKKAKESVRVKNEVMIKNLNTWGKNTEGWIDINQWDECKDEDLEIEDVSHLPAIISLDLSSKLDLTNVKLTFYEGNSVNNLKMYPFDFFFLPEDRLKRGDDQRSDRYKSQLMEWKDEGYIIPSGKSSIDYGFVTEKILDLFEKYDVEKYVYDPWHSDIVNKDLQRAGVPEDTFISYTSTGYKNFDSPMKTLEQMIIDERLIHNGNKVQRWCMENVATKENTYGSIRPVKISDDMKIDGSITMIMAVGTFLWGVEKEEQEKELSPIARRIMEENKKDF